MSSQPGPIENPAPDAYPPEAAQVPRADTVVVVGDGAVGLMGVLAASQMEAERIIIPVQLQIGVVWWNHRRTTLRRTTLRVVIRKFVIRTLAANHRKSEIFSARSVERQDASDTIPLRDSESL